MIVAGSRAVNKASFVETMNGVYPSVEMSMVPDLTTSSDVSDYILESIQENRREFNFGSFVFGDTIDANVNVNWSQLNNNTSGTDLSELLTDALFSQFNTTQIINALNQTLSLLNVPGSEILIFLIRQILENGGSVSDIVDLIISFLGIEVDDVEEMLLDALFNGTQNLIIEGQNFTLNLSKESVESFFNGGNGTYEISVDVPVSIMHNTSSAHR